MLKTKFDEAQPYIGTVPLLTGHLAKDLSFYWVQSEQIPSAVGIRVVMDDADQRVLRADGFLIQAMPGATDEDLQYVESQFKALAEGDLSLGSASASSTKGDASADTPKERLAFLFQEKGYQVLSEKKLSFFCPCSRERVQKSLTLLGPAEIQDMQKDPVTTVTCDFCSETYSFSAEDLGKL